MPKLAKPLTDIQVKNAKGGIKPKGIGGRVQDEQTGKPYTLADGHGLQLLVKSNGSKYWQMQCRFGGAPRLLAFGVYPDVTLGKARELRQQAKTQIAAGIDPAQAKRIEKTNRATNAANTFEAIAREWHANKSETWQPNTARNALHRLEKDVFPLIGKHPIADIKTPTMLDVIRQIEKRGALDMATRVAQFCAQIFRFAIASGISENNPVQHLKGALKPHNKSHHASLTAEELPEFIAAFRKIEGRMFIPTKILFRIMMLVFVRTNELTTTRWEEIDFEKEEWIIPWQRMKMGKKKVNPRRVDHHVFLPRQGWVLLRELHSLTGNNKWVFPNHHDHQRPATDWGILATIKRMGYKGRMTGHGFRSLAMGIIKEKLGYPHDVVNRQLSHLSGDVYGEAYDRALFLPQREKMMQEYADYLEAVEKPQISDSLAKLSTEFWQ
jgi:integrase